MDTSVNCVLIISSQNQKYYFMRLQTVLLTLAVIATSCHSSSGTLPPGHKNVENEQADIFINPYTTIGSIPLPKGFTRQKASGNSFAAWLRNLPLKKDKTVYLYNGQQKINQEAQFAVLDISVGNKDLQQCADAVMRLRAEYLFEQARYDSINFWDNEGQLYKLTAPFTRANFDRYLQRVFGMCGSASLEKQMRPADWENLQCGNVLIRGGFPGHAVMVMDVALDSTGKKIYLLAQSYMPAQDIHILRNPANETHAWYEAGQYATIRTPEWSFNRNQLKQW
jgi:Domain of unknown function (4846)